MEEKQGVKKFIQSADSFCEKASSMLNTAIENKDLKIEEAKEYADLILRVLQSIKLMTTEESPKTGKKKSIEETRTLADRMSQNGKT